MRVLVRSAVGALCALAGCLALGVSAAPAAVSHEFLAEPSKRLSEGVPAEGPHGEPVPLPGPFSSIQSMTVDGGELYVAEGTEASRIDKFNDSTGAFAAQLPQLASPTFLHQSVTVGHSTGEAQVYLGGDESGEQRPKGVVGVLTTAGSLQKTWTGADAPSKGFGCFECFAPASIAVDANPSSLNDWAAGDVYVVDYENHVVDLFKPLAGGGEEYVTQLAGPEPPGVLFSNPVHVAVDPSDGEVVITDRSVSTENTSENVYRFKPAAIAGQYEFLGELAGPPPGGVFGEIANLTVDAGNGDIYIAELGGDVVDEFDSEGRYAGRLTGTPSGPSGEERPFAFASSVAVDPSSHDVYVGDYRSELGEPTIIDVFGPDIVLPDVTTGAVTGLGADGEGHIEATLNGTVNPRKEGETSCQFAWGASNGFGQIAPCQPGHVAEGESPVAVHSKLTGLLPDTTYHERLQAANKNGASPGEAWQDVEFTTPGPGLDGTTVLAVRAESATFNARISPHGAATSYYFQYGTSTAYGGDAPALSEATARGAGIGSGEADVEATQHVAGLSAATLYHYRVVVVSELAPGEFEAFYGPDQTFTTQTIGLPFQLPDGRAWELVSPPHKEGALPGSILRENPVQASADGSAFADSASEPTEAEPAGADNNATVFFGRGTAGWSSKVITPPHNSRTNLGKEYMLFSEDLSQGAVQPLGSIPPLSPEASEATAYLHTDYLRGDSGELCASGCYEPLVSPANVPPGTKFGEETNGQCGGGTCWGPRFVEASPDFSHVVLSARVALTPTPTEGQISLLYEWTAGKLELISLLPEGESNEQGGPVAHGAGFSNDRAGMHEISNDGSRIVWIAPEGSQRAHLYVRDTVRRETTRLDIFQGVPNGPEDKTPAEFQAASGDGSRIFFLYAERLTPDSTAGPGHPDLYEYDLNAPAGSRLTDLSVDATGFADVAAVLGVSEDGSYVYFAAAGALTPSAAPGHCGRFGQPSVQTCNLYVRHDGTTTFIAGLSDEEDFPDWSSELERLTARVSPDGRRLAFMSSRNLTGYDTTDAVSKHPDEEVYAYDAATAKLVCASCNPTGARPVGVKLNEGEEAITGLAGGVFPYRAWIASNVPRWTTGLHQSRYLSNSGRLIFDSNDALAIQDVNGTQDVYEYEPAGVGDCNASRTSFSERSGGCVSLVSSGASKEESGFLDASEGGGSVFFLTAAKLLPQDFDDALDVYDARECAAASPCIAPPPAEPPPCDTGESCKPAPTPQPAIFGAPASATFSGAGNVVPAPPAPAVKQRGSTRRQKLARALRACHKKHWKRWAACERKARARYAANKPRNANATKRGRG